MNLDIIPTSVFENEKCYRLIPSKYPTIALFEDVASQEEFDVLYKIQAITNPRIQDEIGNIELIPKEERVFVISGSSYIMAAFTHPNPNGSRFSNGDYGVYYAARKEETAIKETIYHRERFFQYTNEPAQEIDMRCLVAKFNAELLNICGDQYRKSELYNKEIYKTGQQLGAQVRTEKKDGIHYFSVRHEGEINYALFKPKLIDECKPTSHYCYVWDGRVISSYYKKSLYTQTND